MKIMKYIILPIIIIGLCVSAWFYYPHYQMNKMKKQAIHVNKNTSHLSYMNYFQQTPKKQLNHLALGDSVIRGVGAEENQNLVSQFSNKLQEQIHKKISFHNEGINGITSGELNKLVQSGRFNQEIKNADIITMNVGGNDILQLAKTENFLSVFKQFDHIQKGYTKNLLSMTKTIHQLNPDATIVLLELYNPLSPNDQAYSLSDKLLPKWNVKIYEVANQYPTSIVIETTKVINRDHLNHLSADGVHPNAQGYVAISQQMLYQFKHQYRARPSV